VARQGALGLGIMFHAWKMLTCVPRSHLNLMLFYEALSLRFFFERKGMTISDGEGVCDRQWATGGSEEAGC
jgi:hypothetical protein